MDSLVTTLIEFLEHMMTTRLEQNSSGRVQPVFVGPPTDFLTRVFDTLTKHNSQEWYVPKHPSPIIVLFVDGEQGVYQQPKGTLSQRCNWDYVLANRNSVQTFITLVAPNAWDDRQESITNATETIGNPLQENVQAFLESEPWPFIQNQIARQLGIEPAIVSWGLTHIFKETRSLEAAMRHSIPWRIADELLAATQVQEFVQCIGLPSLGVSPLDPLHLQLSADVLIRNFTRQLCIQAGLREAEKTLRSVGKDLLRQEPELRPLAQPLRALFQHLYTNAGSSSHFEQCPSWYFRPDPANAGWWDALPYDKLQRLLERVGATTPGSREKLEFRCLNPLNGSALLDGEPYLVAGPVELSIHDMQGRVPSSASLSRRPKIKKAKEEDDRIPESGYFYDTAVPPHTQPLIYVVKGEQYQPASINVLSLDSFDCGGYARIRNALHNPAPQLLKGSRGKGTFEQKITLARGGMQELTIYHSSQILSTFLNQESQMQLISEDNPAVFFLDIDEDQEIFISLRKPTGEVKYEWLLRCEVEESDERSTTTRFEALVRAHQTRRSSPGLVAPDRSSYLLEIEKSYIDSSVSWRGVLAGWTSTGRIFRSINWGAAKLGDLPIEDDTRVPYNQATPPQSYLTARANIQQQVKQFQLSLGEIPLSDKNLVDTIKTYLEEYIQWLILNPGAAAWSDCLALYAPLKKFEWEQEIATSEPIALLLSPLHPLRIAWHCYAQQVLDEALLSKLCTAAGILDPHACPGILALPIYRGDILLNWSTFFSVGCDQPHWSFFWHKDFLGNRPKEEKILTETLGWLGLRLNGLTSGFTPSQARRSLDEVSSILSARATLRIGLIGDSQESTGCIEGLLDWCRSMFQENEDGSFQGLPQAGEIYDLRSQPLFPSSAALAILSEETDERVRWFSRSSSPTLKNMDLVILDQVGTRDFRGISAKSRSPLAPGALFRVDIHQDIGDTPIIQESRIGQQQANFPNLEGLLLKATIAVESLALNDNCLSHLQFIPNQRAIGTRLNESRFVAATSSQVDPACFIRGTKGNGGYLWDYELPGTLGFDQQNAGYYLIAKPSASMKQALISTMGEVVPSSLVSNENLIEELLDEVSRRGVPVLKRLVGGGNHARGELGVLLGVRLLQDAFRPKRQTVRLPVVQDGCIHLLLSVDSYREPFRQFQRDLGKDTLGERPDVLVFAIRLPENGEPTQIKVTPLEIKFRDRHLSPNEIQEALQQAATLGKLLDSLWVQEAPNKLWWVCTQALLVQCLDQAFRVYADPRIHLLNDEQWTNYHQAVLHDIMGGNTRLTVNKEGRVFVFDKSLTTKTFDYNNDGEDETIVFSRDDMAYLLANIGALSQTGQTVVQQFGFSFLSAKSDAAPNQIQNPSEEQSTSPATPQTSSLVVSQGTLFSEDFFGPEVPTSKKPRRKEEKQKPSESGEEQQNTVPTSRISPHLRQKVNEVFEDFIGNKAAVGRITKEVLLALTRVPPHLPKNYLLTGQPSVGKTELARRIAKALGLPLVQLDGRGLTSRERLFELIQGELQKHGSPVPQIGSRAGLPIMEYPPLIVFVDEVHLVSKGVQESLLTMLESVERSVMLTSEIAKVEKVTFLFATTRASEIDTALHSRCAEVQLQEYTTAEVAQIVEQRFPDWLPEVYQQIATLARQTPRMAIELAKELETERDASEYPHRTLLEHLEEVRTGRELDTQGLTPLDRRYLRVLVQETQAGENTILNHLRTVDKERVLSEIEPFLLKLGFIRLGRRGREITLEGRQYLQQLQQQNIDAQ